MDNQPERNNGPLNPSYNGYVSSTQDALILFEACLRGVLSRVSRRPHDRERAHLVRSGSIFVYEESSSAIKRWTDGVTWSPSRILGNFLVYRELDKPFPPGEKKRAMRKVRRNNSRSGDPYGRPEASSSACHQNGQNARDVPAAAPPQHFERPHQPEIERALVGSLVDSYGFKPGGLVKKTMSVVLANVTHHLVSYYSVEDVLSGRLRSPSFDPELRVIRPRAALLKQSFRAPITDMDPSMAGMNDNDTTSLYYEPRQLITGAAGYPMQQAYYPVGTIPAYGHQLAAAPGPAPAAAAPAMGAVPAAQSASSQPQPQPVAQPLAMPDFASYPTPAAAAVAALSTPSGMPAASPSNQYVTPVTSAPGMQRMEDFAYRPVTYENSYDAMVMAEGAGHPPPPMEGSTSGAGTTTLTVPIYRTQESNVVVTTQPYARIANGYGPPSAASSVNPAQQAATDAAAAARTDQQQQQQPPQTPQHMQQLPPTQTVQQPPQTSQAQQQQQLPVPHYYDTYPTSIHEQLRRHQAHQTHQAHQARPVHQTHQSPPQQSQQPLPASPSSQPSTISAQLTYQSAPMRQPQQQQWATNASIQG